MSSRNKTEAFGYDSARRPSESAGYAPKTALKSV